MKEHLVSVIMPCYKESVSYFMTAVNSVLQQTFKDIELILILDDPNNAELLRLGNSYAKMDSRVRFFVNERNLKLVATLNKGLKLAEGDVIARLDADDIALPDRIEKQMAFVDEYDLISTNFAFINLEGNIIRHRHFPTNDFAIKKYLTKVADCMYHTTWLGKKSTFTELNGYREIGPFEDYDFLLRAVNKHMKLLNLEEELTYYRFNTEGISYNNRLKQHLGSEFIRDNHEIINEIKEKDIDNYLESFIGKKHASEYIKFCSIKNKLYSSKSTSEYLKKLLFYGPYLSVFNYYGRKVVIDKILSEIFELME